MSNQRYKGLFEDWEVGVATNVIARFRKQWECLRREGFEDLLQQCLMQWHHAKGKYDLLRGPRQKFMAVVIKRELQHIIEKLTSNKRKVFAEAVSLDRCISEGEDSPTYADQLSADEDCASKLRAIAGLKIDIFQTVQKLTPKQKELCHLLGEEGLNIRQASKILQMPRSTIYEDIKRIRTVFEKDGLRDYLK
jgi:DNA-directed RNA polymerase specialized sigma24 family protein